MTSKLPGTLWYFIVAHELAATMTVPVLLAAQRWLGRRGMWASAVLWWGVLGSVAFVKTLPDGMDAQTVTFGAVLFISWILIPTWFLDSKSRRVPAPPLWKRFLYGVLGYNLAALAITAFVLAYALVQGVVGLVL